MKIEFSTEIQILKKTQIEMKNSISSTKRLGRKHKQERDHVQDRILDLEERQKSWLIQSKKMENNHKTEISEIFETSWPNPSITGIEELRIRCIENIFNRIIKENFPNLRKDVAYVCMHICMYMYMAYICIPKKHSIYRTRKKPHCITIKTVNI